MTQIIGVITKQYALLASDRRLTIADGPQAGELRDDDTCKLVSLCHTSGLGYSGVAQIKGQPTHDWIASTLAKHNCQSAAHAAQILERECTDALSKKTPAYRRLIILMTGWADFQPPPGLRSYFCLITNSFDETVAFLTTPRDTFTSAPVALPDDKEFLCGAIGQPLQEQRAKGLERNIGRLVSREIGPKEALRLLMEEIINTSKHTKTVGQKILGLCIPRASVESQRQTGSSFLLAKQPDESQATFTYFEAGYSELVQYGPTFVCGEVGWTDVKTENDPSRGHQSVEARIILPKKPSP